MKQLKTIKREKRECSCCGSSDLELLWDYNENTITRTSNFSWEVSNVVCRRCGFAFVSPVPTQESLEEYYKDCFSLRAQDPGFSIEKRVQIIQKYLKNGNDKKTYIEIGSNNCPDFINKVKACVNEIITVELNDECETSYPSVEDLPPGSGDMLATFFVLEHIPNPELFLKSCNLALKENGVVIIEVPDLYIYPNDPAGLLLCEHVNHFSPTSLTLLAEKCGFKVEEISRNECSLSFGFLAVLRKVEANKDVSEPLWSRSEYMVAKSFISDGKSVINKYKERFIKVRKIIEEYSRSNKKITVWAANHNAFKLFEGYTPPESLKLIDIDPRKRNFIETFTTYEPFECIEWIKETDLLIINSGPRANDIATWIEDNMSKKFKKEQIIVLDYLNPLNVGRDI